jgi:UDP-2-acetamido-2,6-beta-L-arabino-hexul-4-ose reductase
MKALVTGARGFIGKNLCLRLNWLEGVEVVPFGREDDLALIEEHLDSIDIIYHLAGVSRTSEARAFYEGNTDFTKSLVDLVKRRKARPTFVMASTIQARLDNDYGKSKRQAEDLVLSMGADYPTYIYRLHNVFGKWCRPGYNSVVATFCHNVMHDLPIEIYDPDRQLPLVYIDDVVTEFVGLMANDGEGARHKEGDYCFVAPVHIVKVGDLARRLGEFRDMLRGIRVPDCADPFVKKLFSTFVSYADDTSLLCTPVTHTDARGSFTELVHTGSAGQVSVSVSKPGIVRGNHFHDTKLEKFIVLQGKARIRFRHMADGRRMEFDVDGEDLRIVTIPPGYTHNIENTGAGETILLIWSNELLDPLSPDTYFSEV